MNDSSTLHQLFQETAAAYIGPVARVESFVPLPMAAHELGWSGAEIRRDQLWSSLLAAHLAGNDPAATAG